MSKKFKSQASSARAASTAFGSNAFGFNSSAGFQTASSPLAYVAELPDLSGILEPGIVVAFKNLGKRDSVTKSKALEELGQYFASSAVSERGIEAGILEAWISLYPRTSVDNSRRVRQLAHSLQGALTVLSGKRIVPHLSKVIGTWLCGRFDVDKGVSRTVQDGLEKSFPTEEKRRALWRIYKDSLLVYVDDAALLQTPQTLSDERTTSPDDAESKHTRVVGTAIHMLSQLVQSLSTENALKLDPKLSDILHTEKLWSFSYHADPYLRRGVYSLLIVCIRHLPSELDWTVISTSVLSKSLHISQLGSSGQYSEALLAVTEARPEVWTTEYTANTSISRRFLQFLRQGSQRGPEAYWTNIGKLVRRVPISIWGTNNATGDAIVVPDCSTLIKAVHEGLTSPDEPRQNSLIAWSTYIDLCFWAVDHLVDRQAADKFLTEHLLPVIDQHVSNSTLHPEWNISANASMRVCTYCLTKLVTQGYLGLLEESWVNQVNHIVKSTKLSLPETSKDFVSSQDCVLGRVSRFSSLQNEVNKTLRTRGIDHGNARDIFQSADLQLLSASLEILQSRNGKPYGAAGTIQAMIPLLDRQCQPEALNNFLELELPKLLTSPSSKRLVSILFLCRSYAAYPLALQRSVEVLLNAPGSTRRTESLTEMLQTIDLNDVPRLSGLEDFVFDSLDHALKGNASSWPIVLAVMRNIALYATSSGAVTTPKMPERLSDQILAQVMDGLSLEATVSPAMTGLYGLLQDKEAAHGFVSQPFAAKLLPKLVILSDSVDERIANQAKQLNSTLRLLLAGKSSSALTTSTLDLIKKQLSGVGPLMSIFGLIDLAQGFYASASIDSEGSVAVGIMPSADHWRRALAPLQADLPATATAITSPLQGLVYSPEKGRLEHEEQIRDSEDLSLAFRLAFYTIRLSKSTNAVDHIDANQMQDLVMYLSQALDFINDKITMDSASTIWLNSTPEVLEEGADIVSDGQTFIKNWLKTVKSGAMDPSDVLRRSQQWLTQLNGISLRSAECYHLGKSFVNLLLELVDLYGPTTFAQVWDHDLKNIRTSENLVKSGLLIVVLRDTLAMSGQGKKLCNELVADASEIKALKMTPATLRTLTLANLLLQGDDGLIENVQSSRVVFLLKNLVRLLTSKNRHMGLFSETLKLISALLPAVVEIYGEHWQGILDGLVGCWKGMTNIDENLPAVYSSLRILQQLRTLAKGEVNEDLKDAWEGSQAELHLGLIGLLQLFNVPSPGSNQPRDITADLLRRQLSFAKVSLAQLGNVYSLLSSQETSVQSAAYQILHQAIPAAQEQVSLDITLEHNIVQLPSELLSFLASPPPVSQLDRSNIDNIDSLSDMRRYLLSWSLLFDHFVNASYKLKEMYAMSVKNCEGLSTLMAFICEMLQVTGGKPLDGSKYNFIDPFMVDTSRSSNREAQWLTIHLYYNCLRHVPSLTKEWFIQQKNRIKSPLESWTHKHMSPLIVAATLSEVSEWAATQDSDDRPVTIKASPKGSDLAASIAIDEESPPISLVISLPGAYPLEQAVVSSRNRVGVSDKNWQSWLRTFQIIIFSTGSLIEGLIAFRRNVQGALKGQSECAICYSIIGTDMQIPNKKCGTCKNTFHSVCLYRWFKSSNSSSCPLCRNNFNYA